MDTFEFKIKCFCLVIFLLAFTILSKAQNDPHSPTPEEPYISYETKYIVASKNNHDFKASVYIEDNKYYFYQATFSPEHTAAVASFLAKELGQPVFQEGSNLAWETIDDKVVRSLLITLKNGKVVIKSRHLENGLLLSLENLTQTINNIIGAKLIAKTNEATITLESE